MSDFSIAENLHKLRQSLWTYKLSLNAYVREGRFLCSHSYRQGQRGVYITELLPRQQAEPPSQKEAAELDSEILESNMKQSKTGTGLVQT